MTLTPQQEISKIYNSSKIQEDVNGEKLTVKKWWIFGADFFTVYADFSRFVRDINGEKKNISLSMSFFTVSFSRFAPSRKISLKYLTFTFGVITFSLGKERSHWGNHVCFRGFWVTLILSGLLWSQEHAHFSKLA